MRTVHLLTLSRILLLLAVTIGAHSVSAQAPENNPDQVYGFDPLLYNGRIYSFYPEPGTEGTQFLFDEFDAHGSVTLRSVTYSNVKINYDVYNQQLILEYKNAIGSASQIEISKAWLEMFDLHSCHFEMHTYIDTTKRIFQVLGNGPVKVLYYQRKELSVDTRTSSKKRFFSDAITERFISAGNKLLKYKNNRSFIAFFNSSDQDFIKKYLRKYKIKVKKAKDQQMTELITYCNTLSGS